MSGEDWAVAPDGFYTPEDLLAQQLVVEHNGFGGWSRPVMVGGEDGIDVFVDEPTASFVISLDGPDHCLVDGMCEDDGP